MNDDVTFKTLKLDKDSAVSEVNEVEELEVRELSLESQKETIQSIPKVIRGHVFIERVVHTDGR